MKTSGGQRFVKRHLNTNDSSSSGLDWFLVMRASDLHRVQAQDEQQAQAMVERDGRGAVLSVALEVYRREP